MKKFLYGMLQSQWVLGATTQDWGHDSSWLNKLASSSFLANMVLGILILLSVLSWGIALGKFLYLRKVEKRCLAFRESFRRSSSLTDLTYRLGDFPYSPLREVFRQGYREVLNHPQIRTGGVAPDILARLSLQVERVLDTTREEEKKSLENYVSFLAICASVSPFIGLFGTVWGVMTSFEAIARSGAADLSAVAPGLSEALIATAFGLAAAIPSAVGYNLAAVKIRGLLQKVDQFSNEFLNIVERTALASSPETSSVTRW